MQVSVFRLRLSCFSSLTPDTRHLKPASLQYSNTPTLRLLILSSYLLQEKLQGHVSGVLRYGNQCNILSFFDALDKVISLDGDGADDLIF
jgi:hypothetical protein